MASAHSRVCSRLSNKPLAAKGFRQAAHDPAGCAAAVNVHFTYIYCHALQDIVLTDGQHNITCDAAVQQLQPGQRVLVRSAYAQEAAVFQVSILLDRRSSRTAMSIQPQALGSSVCCIALEGAALQWHHLLCLAGTH